MKKRVFGRQLGRTKNQRRALFRGLTVSLVEKGEIITTLAKAKAVRSDLEKLITKAKSGTLADRRMIFRYLGRRDLVNRMVDSIGVIFKDRPGGYLRIIRLAKRRGDLADTAKIMLTETPLAKPILTSEDKLVKKPSNPSNLPNKSNSSNPSQKPQIPQTPPKPKVTLKKVTKKTKP